MAFIGNTNTTQAFTPAVDYFSGNGSTTAFTLSRPVASVAQVQAVVNNVAQNPSDAFTVSGNTITFTSAPSSGTNNIYVYYTSPITQVIAPGQGTVNTTSLGNITNIASGNSSLTLRTGTTPTTALTINTSQNVGIGITPNTSQGRLQVTNTGIGGGAPASSGTTDANQLTAFGMGSTQLRFGAYLNGNAWIQQSSGSSYATNYDLVLQPNGGNVLLGGNLQFNSGYGSVATAYGCRAWVNFNGTGTVAIRASGNVSSITDNGTGDYTVNFTNAMPDANYNAVSMGQRNDFNNGDMNISFYGNVYGTAIGTGSVRVNSAHASSYTLSDALTVCVAIFR